MLSTLLFVLKMLLTVFLAILALAVLILLLVLCVPIRYRIGGSYGEELSAEIKITWLCHLLSVPVTYDKTLKASVKVLGFPVIKIGGEQEREEEEQWEQEEPPQAEEEKKSNTQAEAQEDQRDRLEAEYRLSQAEVSEDKIEENPAGMESSSGPEENNCIEAKRKKRGKGKKVSLTGFWESIKLRIQTLCQKAEEGKELYERVCDFVCDKANQKSFRQVLRILKHVLPKKIFGNVTFGFRDPAMTGKVLALLGFACSWYGDTIEVTPMFEEEIIEGSLRVKGRIFPGALLFWCLNILMNKNIRRLIWKRGRKKDGGREDGRK